MDRSCPVIIAMKGHPGSGKSTLAHAIASAIRCPLLDKDDIRDCTGPLEHHHHLNPALLNDLSYSVLWRMANTQLCLGLHVVIDSPLSRRAHLDSLMSLLGGGGPRKARLVIVECRAGDKEEWRRRLERRTAASDGEAGWHKPGTWQELQRLVEGYNGCNDYDVGDVPKLVVDTTGGAGVEELVARVLQFVGLEEVGQQFAAWGPALAGMSGDLPGLFHFGNDLSETQVM
ncbi:hypothetical protein ACLOJK_020037 [Asimina triloba]